MSIAWNSGWTFIGLQFADLISTLIFLQLGVHEGNPIIVWLVEQTNPYLGLVAIKLVATIMGATALYYNLRIRATNIFFFALVIWNLVAITVALLAT